MSLDIDDTDKLGAFVQEARRMGVKVLAPCMNASGADFSVAGDAIRYALGAVRNVGLAAMKAVIAQRPERGFADLFDLMERIDPKALNRRTLENLARAGALDALEPDRARAFAAAEVVCAHGQRHAGEQASSQVSLFAAAPGEIRRPPLPQARAWSAQERLDNEFAALGLYLSGHPLSDIADALRRNQTVFINEAADRAQEGAGMFRMAGIVRARKERMSNQGTGKFAWVSFSDPTGEFEAFVAPEVLSQYRDLLEPGRAVTFRAKARASEGELKLSADQIEALETASHLGACRGLKVFVARGASAEPAAAALRAVAGQAQQKAALVGELMLVIQTAAGGEVVVRAPGRWPVGLAARQALKGAPGVAAVADYM
jgi:DNA polymerase-3 subunit alpha